jgi:predicted nucleotidyltransferase
MFQTLLEHIARGLDARGFSYMVIGGQAVLLYGEPRLTRDIDITLGVGPEKLPALLDWLHESGWPVLVDSPTEFVAKTLVLPCKEPRSGIRVDFIFSFSHYERQAIQRARRVAVGETQVRFASGEDLVIHKVVAGRPRDIEDVRSILLKNPELDVAYIRRWLEELGAGRQEDLVGRFEELWKQRGGRPQDWAL